MCCDEIRQQLEDFAAGRLPMALRCEMAEHLRNCAACRRALSEHDAVSSVLCRIQTSVPAGFTSRVLRRAHQRVALVPVATTRWPARLGLNSLPMGSAAAAVLAVGVTLGLLMGSDVIGVGGAAAPEGEPDPAAAYGMDSLGEAPDGSLAQSYLTVVEAAEKDPEP